MKIAVVSEDEMKKLRDALERHELEELRVAVRIEAIADAKKRFEEIGLLCVAALDACNEAYVQLAEDDLDDFETAQDKAEKLERIERQHDLCIAVWENQLRRLNWEARQARETL